MAKWTTEIDVPELGELAATVGSSGEVEVEDGGCALIYHVEDDSDNTEGFFVQLRSWKELTGRIRDDDTKGLRAAHPQFAEFAGKRVRVTVETVS